ncbi:hypothetical protein B0H19DRAFT_1259972 [Mycena capillaripes]|nr:hypothetical protein B0H19DRAFT_1259972 [Mycena capillaripes]
MPAGDLSTALIGIVSLWSATVLYGINIVVFIICVAILVKKRTAPGESIPWYLPSAICFQFVISTAHIAVALGAGVHAFNTVKTTSKALIQTWISPLGTFTNLQQLFYAINNFVGDLILIWQLYVVYGSNWYITILPLLLASASVACTQYAIITTFLDPALILRSTQGGRNNGFSQVVTAGFALTGATQILVTILLALKIYTATRSLRQLSRGSKKHISTYSDLMWMLVESGAALSVTEIVFLAVWRTGFGGLSQLSLAILGQLCGLIPLSIVARVGLRLSFNGGPQDSGLVTASSGRGGSSATLQFRARPGNASGSDMDTVNLSEFKASVWSDGIPQEELGSVV